jgi:hypothetical protein
MRTLAHVPVQTWRGWDPNDVFGRWFSALGGFQTLIGAIGLILGTYLILPCLAALVPLGLCRQNKMLLPANLPQCSISQLVISHNTCRQQFGEVS